MFTPNPGALASLVIDQRKKLKLTQKEVGELVGLKQKTISAFENKPEGTKLETLFRILSAVNLDMTILCKDRPKNPLWTEKW